MKMLRKVSNVIFAAGAALALSACATTQVDKSPVKEDQQKAFVAQKKTLEKSRTIAPGFLLRINHSADAKLSGDYKVSFKGFLKLPFKMEIRAAGLTPEKLASSIEKMYAGYFKVKNEVSVEIASREYSIELRGLVNKPGNYNVKLDTSIEEVIAMAGGLQGSERTSDQTTAQAKPEYVRIVRPEFQAERSAETEANIQWLRLSDYFVNYDASNEILWHGGEQLFFQLAGDATAGSGVTIQVLGEVHRPGTYPAQSGTDVLSYIAKAGGPTATSDMSRITVFHKSKDTSQVLDLAQSTAFTDLVPGDVVLVGSTNIRPGIFERVGPTLIAAGNLVISIVILFLTL